MEGKISFDLFGGSRPEGLIGDVLNGVSFGGIGFGLENVRVIGLPGRGGSGFRVNFGSADHQLHIGYI